MKHRSIINNMKHASGRIYPPNAGCIAVLVCLLFTLIFSSCSNTKYLTEGEYLYTDYELKLDKKSKEITTKNELASMEQVILPKPNKKFLGARMKLAIYNRVKEPKKETGFKHWLKYKLGEPPVLLSDVNSDRTAKLIENRLDTYGHFRSSVGDTVIRDKQKATIIYSAHVARTYQIDSVFFPEVKDRLTKKIDQTRDSSLLRPGDAYNLQVIKAERERIDRMLKIEGYYYFNPEFIIVRVDTNVGDHNCKMYVNLKRNLPPDALRYFYIGDIYVYPEYSLNQTEQQMKTADTLLVDSMYYVTPQHLFKPHSILRSVYFQTGKIYDARNYDLTLSRLIGLGVFKFGNIKFDWVI